MSSVATDNQDLLMQISVYTTTKKYYFSKHVAFIFAKKYILFYLHCDYRNRGHPDNENQSQGRTETKDSNIFKLSQSNVGYRTVKSQLVDRRPVMNTSRRRPLNFQVQTFCPLAVVLHICGF